MRVNIVYAVYCIVNHLRLKKFLRLLSKVEQSH